MLAQSSCWLYAGTVNKDDYGVVWDKVYGNYRLAHRVVYESLLGPIKDNLPLDHLCRVPRCINPEHLDPVTLGENVLRGVGIAASYARRTRCVNGHQFTANNIYYWKDKKCRFCKTCRKIQQEKYKIRQIKLEEKRG